MTPCEVCSVQCICTIKISKNWQSEQKQYNLKIVGSKQHWWCWVWLWTLNWPLCPGLLQVAVCMITVSLRALHCVGDVDCRGAAAGLSVGGCVLHAARCGEMTPPPRPWLLSSSYTRVYQVIPTQPQHFPINEYHKMQFLLKVLPSRSRRKQTPADSW